MADRVAMVLIILGGACVVVLWWRIWPELRAKLRHSWRHRGCRHHWHHLGGIMMQGKWHWVCCWCRQVRVNYDRKPADRTIVCFVGRNT